MHYCWCTWGRTLAKSRSNLSLLNWCPFLTNNPWRIGHLQYTIVQLQTSYYDKEKKEAHINVIWTRWFSNNFGHDRFSYLDENYELTLARVIILLEMTKRYNLLVTQRLHILSFFRGAVKKKGGGNPSAKIEATKSGLGVGAAQTSEYELLSKLGFKS